MDRRHIAMELEVQMPLYLTRKSIRELAHLSPSERADAWRAAASKATADWQYWATLVPVLAFWGVCVWFAADLLGDWKTCGVVGCVSTRDIGGVIGFVIGVLALRLVAVSRVRHHLRAERDGLQVEALREIRED